MNEWPLLTLLTFLPLLGAAAILMLGSESRRLQRSTALGVSLANLALALVIWAGYDSAVGGLQYVQRLAWMPSLGVDYFVGLDGISLIPVLLTCVLVPFSLALTSEEDSSRGYHALILLLQTGLIGTFTALNFVHWFVFWELALIPAWFLVKLWGGRGAHRIATQFFVYTMVGSVGLLLAFVAVALAVTEIAPADRFNFVALAELAADGRLGEALRNFAPSLPTWAFALAFLGFAVKIPIWPFHTWLPQTYTEAPTRVTLLLTGAMSKMGVYGLIRILLPIFPQQLQQWQTPLLWLAVASIVFSAAAALVQTDLKRMLAYSSVNHLGYCALAVFAVAGHTPLGQLPDVEQVAALNGAVLQMFNHGVVAAALFGFVALIERRADGRRGLEDFGGLRKPAPVFCGLMGISLFASLGLPGLNGFVGEFLIFKGAFALTGWAAVLATPGLLLTALFLLNALQKVFAGPLNPRWSDFPDLTPREIRLFAPLVGLMFLLGVWPQLLMAAINPATTQLVRILNL